MKSFYKWSVKSVEVHSIDESIVNHYFNDEGEKIAVFSLDVNEAEEYVKLLQEAIKKCKESEYYHE